MSASVRAGALALAVASSSCAPALLRLPEGPAVAARDGADVLAEAAKACSSITYMTSEIGVSGSLGGRRLSGRLLAGFAAPDSVHLDAVAPFGESLFMFVARGGQATLLLPRDDRVLEGGEPAAVLEAITGIALDAAALRRVLTGCLIEPDPSSARQPAPDWRQIRDGDGEGYFRREQGTWRLVASLRRATTGDEWRVEYRNFLGGIPRAIRLASLDRRRFDLRMELSQVEVNVPVSPDAFQLKIPPGVAPISLEELRRAGPLAAPGG
jgi:hypothetical protein